MILKKILEKDRIAAVYIIWYILYTPDHYKGNQVTNMAEPKVFSRGHCSKEFSRAFVRSGSIRILCEACGRTHFHGSDNNDWEEREHEHLLESHGHDQERFIVHSGGIPWGHIQGKQVVCGCPCGYDVFIERKYWDDRFWLLGFFKKRAEREKADADEMAVMAAKASDVVTG